MSDTFDPHGVMGDRDPYAFDGPSLRITMLTEIRMGFAASAPLALIGPIMPIAYERALSRHESARWQDDLHRRKHREAARRADTLVVTGRSWWSLHHGLWLILKHSFWEAAGARPVR